MTGAAPRLTVDAGNTRVKLVLWGAGEEPLGAWRLDWEEVGAAALARLLGEAAGRRLRVGLSSVAAPARGEALALLLDRLGELRRAPDHGLSNATLDPPGVGPDRLYAARGALALAGGAALVVDAGTALTVDAVVPDAGGTFLGGAIAPGPALLARSLAGDAGGPARLPRVVAEPEAPALGRTTEQAIRAGVAVGFRGAARELVAAVGSEAGLERAAVVVTGGAAAFLAGAFPARRVLACDELVHRGLLLALDGARGPG